MVTFSLLFLTSRPFLFTLEVLLEAKRQRQVLYEAKRQRQRPLTFIILLINPSILFLTKS